MFKRVIYDNWSLIVPVAAFAFTATIYFVMVTRALLMKRGRSDQMAALPLEDVAPTPDSSL
jgi:hypothetical protein